ncbi:hypothetical protein CYMTET_52053 [Cymbomonas tetramitiformis]|uniref:Pre-mRNA 3'-end-processing endonuclease polyadenylation factor C-term domain-containing protein n=1 Tax=Cymbomonas tetramitiformis TaxID=36881 RepID=A0AAE0BJW4_9CHLO|nr:hypothetical protein CYMTET_52053 [Cymbomonas tetramitiformis]
MLKPVEYLTICGAVTLTARGWDGGTFVQLMSGSVLQRQSVPYRQGLKLLAEKLMEMFDGVEFGEKRDLASVQISDMVTILEESSEYVVMEWAADPVADMVADAALTIVLDLDSDTGMVLGRRWDGQTRYSMRKAEGVKKEEEEEEEEEEKLGGGKGGEGQDEDIAHRDVVTTLLRNMFGSVEMSNLADSPNKSVVTVDGVTATIDHNTNEVTCECTKLIDRIQLALRRVKAAIRPIDCGS